MGVPVSLLGCVLDPCCCSRKKCCIESLLLRNECYCYFTLPGKYCSMTAMEVLKCSTRPTTLYRVSRLYFAIWKKTFHDIMIILCYLKSMGVSRVGALKVWTTKIGELHILACSTYLNIFSEKKSTKVCLCTTDRLKHKWCLTWHSRSPLMTQDAKSFVNHSWGGDGLPLHLFELLR